MLPTLALCSDGESGVKVSWAAILCAAALFFAAAPGCADDADSNWEGYGSLGVGLLPDYDGSKYYEVLPYIEARLNYGNYYARFDGGALRFNIVDDEAFHAGPLLGYRRGRGTVDSAIISKLSKFNDMLSAGGFVEWEHVADDPRSGESVMIAADDAVMGTRSGWQVVLRADMRRPVEAINPGFIVTVEGDATWSTDEYMQSYFGISPADSAASGLPVYSAGDGFSQLGAALCVDQFLSRHWSVGLRMHYGRMMSDAARSPITSVAGSPNQYFLGAVVGYVL